MAGAGAGASSPPPNKDEKNPLDSGAGAGVVVVVVAAAGLLTGAGAGAGGSGGAALVDTLMDGLNAKEGSVVSFLLSKSERSVVSFSRLVTPLPGIDGLGGANEEDDGGVGGEMVGSEGTVSNNDGDAVR